LVGVGRAEKVGGEGDRVTVGFVGFGEVASTFARPIADRGVAVLAYDLLSATSEGLERLRARAGGMAVHFCSLEEMIARADYVFSTAATHVAVQIARDSALYLRAGQTFVDLNSASPAVKIEIGKVIVPTGATYVEGAILGAVGATGAQTKILLGGSAADEAAVFMRGLGLNATFYHAEIGKASAFKMLRSVFSKGLEALLIEFLVAGRRAGLERELWEEIAGLMAHVPFEQTAANWVRSHATAYERRYHEMVQVAETVRELGLDPTMTEATVRFFERSCALGLAEAFPQKPDAMDPVIRYMDKHLQE